MYHCKVEISCRHHVTLFIIMNVNNKIEDIKAPYK